jgi:hypothetical protein
MVHLVDIPTSVLTPTLRNGLLLGAKLVPTPSYEKGIARTTIITYNSDLAEKHPAIAARLVPLVSATDKEHHLRPGQQTYSTMIRSEDYYLTSTDKQLRIAITPSTA